MFSFQLSRLSFETLSQKMENQTGARRFGWALLFGALSALAFPPFNLVPLLWVCFPALIFLVRGTKGWRGAAVVGWAFAFGQLVPNLYWIAGALLVDLKTYGWLIPFAVAGLPAFFSLDYAILTALSRRWIHKPVGSLAFALLWFLGDYARGNLFTGFPWDLTGYVWGAFPQVLQITSVIGIYGLGLLTLIVVCLPALLVGQHTTSLRFRRGLVAAGVAFILALGLWGTWRLGQGSKTFVADARVRLVQPAVLQTEKWRAEDREERFQNLLALSFAEAEKPITHIVWPETASAFYLSEDVSHRLILSSLLPPDVRLITGSVQRAVNPNDKTKMDYFNSLIAIDHSGHVVAGYDKFHLVPFGEYVPYRDYIPLKAVASLGVNFTAGDGVHTLHVKGLPPFSPLVCYEAIFSGEVADRESPPSLLINVTNDAWYDGTTGPAQHFSLVRIRAIEEGVPLIRVANKGITAMVDGYGRTRASIDGKTPGFVDSDVPNTTSDRTIFSLYGEKTLWGLFSLFFFFVIFGLFQARINPLYCATTMQSKK